MGEHFPERLVHEGGMADMTTCPGCETPVRVPEGMAGKRAQCPQCQTTFTIPAAGSAAAPAPPVVEFQDLDRGIALPARKSIDDEDRARRRQRDWGDDEPRPHPRERPSSGSALLWALGIAGVALLLVVFCGGGAVAIAILGWGVHAPAPGPMAGNPVVVAKPPGGVPAPALPGGPGVGLGGKGPEAVIARAYDGVIKGKVTYDGTPPKMAPLTGIDQHADKASCHKGPVTDQTWLVDDKGGVANVIVYLEPTGGKVFAVEKRLAGEHKDAWIDQPFCVYEPQTVALFARYYDKEGTATDTGLKFVAKNSSTLPHNTKVSGNGKKRGNPESQDKNIAAAGGSEWFEIVYQKEPLAIGCTKHTWMTASLKTFDHPFFAVTGKDGTYEILNVPVDLEVIVRTWHKDAGDVTETKTFKTGNNDLNLKVKKG